MNSTISAHSFQSSAKIGTADDWNERAEMVLFSGTEVMVEMSAQLWVSDSFHDFSKLDSQKQALANADDQSYAAVCQALATYDATDRLSEITLPLLTVAGDQDQMCTVADAQQISSAAQNGSTAVVKNAAHLLPLEAPQQLAELLDSHL